MPRTAIKIDPEFRALIPPLTDEERRQLEENILADGCRDPLVTWCGLLIDGHNRYEICEANGKDYDVTDLVLANRNEAKAWIIRNQFGRRNLTPYQRAELAMALEPLIAAKAKEQQIRKPVSQKSVEQKPIDTQKELARVAGVSHDTIHKAKVISEKAPEPVKEQLRRGEVSINKAYSDVVREGKRTETVAKLTDIATQKAKELQGVYDVAVIDPPWPMEKIDRDCRPNQTEFDYPTMQESQLAEMKLPLADNAHVWLWTTHKFLPMAMRLLIAWDLKYCCAFVWHKPGGFQPIGLPQFNCEFALYARKNTPAFIDTKAFNVCFDAPRGKHSEKPEEFYDVVRRVTAGRRVDMFNRRKIDGFDGWGKEAADVG